MKSEIIPKLVKKLEKSGLHVESYVSPEISTELIRNVADFYRYIFNNNGHYLVFPTTMEFISPQHIFAKADNETVDLKTMDALTEFPVHPKTGERAIFWHDPEVTFARISQKLAKDGHVTILRDPATGDIEGLSFGYQTTLREQFEYEGWRNPLYYSGKELPEHLLDFDTFLSKIRAVMQQHPDQFANPDIAGSDNVYSWNCITTSPKARGIDSLLAITSQYFASIPEAMKQKLLTIGETRFESASHGLFSIAGYIDVPGILSEKEMLTKQEDTLITIARLAVISQIFSLPPEKFCRYAQKSKLSTS